MLKLPAKAQVRYCGLVIVGLNDDLDSEEKSRIEWLSSKLAIGEARVQVMTYSNFLMRLEARLAP